MAQDELNAADQEKMIGIAILSFISLVTLVFYFFVKNALSVIRVSYHSVTITYITNTASQVFAKEVMEKVRELDAEKMKTEKAFHDFLPTSVVRDMKKHKVCSLVKITPLLQCDYSRKQAPCYFFSFFVA